MKQRVATGETSDHCCAFRGGPRHQESIGMGLRPRHIWTCVFPNILEKAKEPDSQKQSGLGSLIIDISYQHMAFAPND
jgi:hypothetical protein